MTRLHIILFLTLTFPLFAEEPPSISFSKTAPSENLVFQNEKTSDPSQSPALVLSDSPLSSKRVGNAMWVQEDATLDKITLHVVNISETAQGAPITVSIVQMDKNNPYGRPGDTLQIDERLIVPAETENNGYLTFDISDLQLQKNHWYGFILHFDEAAPNRRINFSQAVRRDEPRAGLFYSTDEGVSYEVGNTSLHFFLQTK